MHEASLHEVNCVVTLTYDEVHLPADGSLDKLAVPRTVRKLRKRGFGCRYFQCGEYGDREFRPHYHAALFGLDFPDKCPTEKSKSGADQWVSATLDSVWGQGLATIGTLNFESAAYIARYVTKKVTGKKAAEHYARVDPFTGEMYQLEPEFATMSRRPGIAAGWFEKFAAEVYPSDEVISRGRRAKPPRYYDKVLEKTRPKAMEYIRNKRAKEAKANDEGGVRRLYVSQAKKAQQKHKNRRSYENE